MTFPEPRIEYAQQPQITLTVVREWHDYMDPPTYYWMQQIRVVCIHGSLEDVWPPPETANDSIEILARFALAHKKRFGCTCIVDACMTHFGELLLVVDEEGTTEDIAAYVRIEEESPR